MQGKILWNFQSLICKLFCTGDSKACIRARITCEKKHELRPLHISSELYRKRTSLGAGCLGANFHQVDLHGLSILFSVTANFSLKRPKFQINFFEAWNLTICLFFVVANFWNWDESVFFQTKKLKSAFSPLMLPLLLWNLRVAPFSK